MRCIAVSGAKAMIATSFLQSTRAFIPVPHRTPTQLAARLGLHGKRRLPRGYRGREIAAGLAALAGFLGSAIWARVFGDWRDRAALRIGRRTDRHTARNISIAIGAVAGITLAGLGIAALLSSRARR